MHLLYFFQITLINELGGWFITSGGSEITGTCVTVGFPIILDHFFFKIFHNFGQNRGGGFRLIMEFSIIFFSLNEG